MVYLYRPYFSDRLALPCVLIKDFNGIHLVLVRHRCKLINNYLNLCSLPSIFTNTIILQLLKCFIFRFLESYDTCLISDDDVTLDFRKSSLGRISKLKKD